MLSGLGEWSGVDTPQTVMTTRAPAVLIILEITVLVGLHRGRVKSITEGKLEGKMEIDEL